MSTAFQTKGLKRICRECSTRFYDFNQRPIVCPSCKTEFVGDVKTKGKKGRSTAANDEKAKVIKKTAKEKAGRNEAKAEDEIDLEDEDVVSLEAVAADEDIDDEDEFEIDLDLGDEEIDLDDEDLEDLGNLDDIDLDEEDDDIGEDDED